MIYRFKSKADGDLLMTQDVAEQILKVLNKEGVQGILHPEEMVSAVAKLVSAAVDDDLQRAQAKDVIALLDELDEESGPDITMRQRVWPFIEMIKRCLREDQPIVWGV